MSSGLSLLLFFQIAGLKEKRRGLSELHFRREINTACGSASGVVQSFHDKQTALQAVISAECSQDSLVSSHL